MGGAGLEADQIARIVEVADLAAAIAQQSRGANRAGDHAVDEVRLFVLPKDLFPFGERHPHAKPLHRAAGSGVRQGGGLRHMSEGHVISLRR